MASYEDMTATLCLGGAVLLVAVALSWRSVSSPASAKAPPSLSTQRPKPPVVPLSELRAAQARLAEEEAAAASGQAACLALNARCLLPRISELQWI